MRQFVWRRKKRLRIILCRIYLFVYIIFNKRTQGTALAWREGLRRPLASKVLRLLLKPFQKVLNSRPDAQTAELFGITQKPHPLRISRTPAEHPTTPGRFPAGFCMRENCLKHGDFTLAHSLCHTSTTLFVIFFNLTPSLQHIPSVTRQQLFSLYSSTSRLHYSLPLLSHVSRRGTVWFVLALQEGCAS